MKILIGGDVVPSASSTPLFEQAKVEQLFGRALQLMRGADHTIVNLECALTHSEAAIPKFGPNLKSTPACARGLAAAGITDVMLANNHVYDFGDEGLGDTMRALEEAGIAYAGAGENDTLARRPHVLVGEDGVRVGIINVCEHEYTYALPDRMGANPFLTYGTMQDIRALRGTVDYLIVIYHGAKEYCRYPSPRIYELCREMVHSGADLVLTQHSHCIGCVEEYEGATIVHGQGNFHFCAYGTDRGEMWNTGMLVEVELRGRERQVRLHPTVSDGVSHVDLADGELGRRLSTQMLARNRELASGAWRQEWHEFCETLRERYTGAVEGFTADADETAREYFRHLLDCEAHTDVWHEIFPTWHRTGKPE